ncbi:unnamed protein product, partial [Prorocentrum cordatum]
MRRNTASRLRARLRQKLRYLARAAAGPPHPPRPDGLARGPKAVRRRHHVLSHHDSSQTLGQERIPLCPRGQAARAVVALFGCMDVLWNCVYTPTALMASTAPSLSPRLHREAPPQQRKVTCCPNRKPLPCHRRCSIPCHMGGP